MFHLTDDVLLQAEGAVKYFIPVVVFVVWLYGTLMLSNRVSGYVIMLLGGLVAAGMIVVHSKVVSSTNPAASFSCGRCSRSAQSVGSPQSSRPADCGEHFAPDDPDAEADTGFIEL